VISFKTWRPLLSILLALLIVAAVGASSIVQKDLPATGCIGTSCRPFDYVVIILMENKSICEILTTCGGTAPYMTSLALNYSLARNYTAIHHPSLPNYLDVTGGSNFGVSSDCDPTQCPVNATTANIVDRIESRGLTWKAWAEDYPVPQGCSTAADNGEYVAKHFPFVYYQDISGSRCNNLYAANTVVSNTTEADDIFLSALGSTYSAANYMWLTPNEYDDMHSSSIGAGDTYLSQLVPSILKSYIFTHQRAALFITFDEGHATYPSDYVYTVWAGPAAKTHYQSSNYYSHFSFLKTLETAWGLQPLTANDNSAASMSEFLTASSAGTGLQASFTNTPTNLGITQQVTLRSHYQGNRAVWLRELRSADTHAYR